MRTPTTALVALAASVILGTIATAGDVTRWDTEGGVWSDANAWTAGVPTPETIAEVGVGVATVIASGQTCQALNVSPGTSGGVVRIGGGSLTVSGDLDIGGGVGSVTVAAGSLTAASTSLTTGTLNLSGGEFATENLFILGGQGAAFVEGGVHEVSEGFIMTGSMTLSGGMLDVGRDPADMATIQGNVLLAGDPAASFQNLTLGGESTVRVALSPSAPHAAIHVAGTATLDGTLILFDGGVEPGRYDVIDATAVSGTFDAVELPEGGGWSWGVDGGTVHVTRGDVPVAVRSWSEVKAAFTR